MRRDPNGFPGTSAYVSGTNVGIAQTTNAGYFFINWTGAFTGVTPTGTILMNSDKTVTANYGQILPPIINIATPGVPASNASLGLPTTNPASSVYEYRMRTSEDNGLTYTPWTSWTVYNPSSTFPVFPQFATLAPPPPPIYTVNGVLQPIQTSAASPLPHPWNSAWTVTAPITAPIGSTVERVVDPAITSTRSNLFVSDNQVTGTWRTVAPIAIRTEIQARVTYLGFIANAVLSSQLYTGTANSTPALYSYILLLYPPTVRPQGNVLTSELIESINDPRNPPASTMSVTVLPTGSASSTVNPYATALAMFPQESSVTVPPPAILPTTGTYANNTPFTVSLPSLPATLTNGRLLIEGGNTTIATGNIVYAVSNPFNVRARVAADITTRATGVVNFRGLSSTTANGTGEPWPKTLYSVYRNEVYTPPSSGGAGPEPIIPEFELDNP